LLFITKKTAETFKLHFFVSLGIHNWKIDGKFRGKVGRREKIDLRGKNQKISANAKKQYKN